MVRGLGPDSIIRDPHPVMAMLEKYAEMIGPWATSVANFMLADINRRNLRSWQEQSKEMARALRAEIAYAPTGMVYEALMAENVTLIKSVPLDAAQRIHGLVMEARIGSKRHEEIASMILSQGRVSANKATLIARTESSRAAVSLTQARAMYAGSPGYIWRTAHDADVRPTHQAMEGVYVPWDKPPKTDKSLDPYHAGCGPNCRCYPEPILPD